MHLPVATAIIGLCASAHAFTDSSPFILFSTAKLSKPATQDQLQSSSRVIESAKKLLSSCPTDHYLLVSQPNLNAAHLSSPATVPNLSKSLNQAASSYSIAEVAGDVDLKSIAAYIQEKCGLPRSAVEQIAFAPVPSPAAGAADALKQNDDKLGAFLEHYAAAADSYTVIYAGVPGTEKAQMYVPEFTTTGVDQSELKRQLHVVERRQEAGNKKLPLFEKYQFFTPGIFMGLIALFILISILYVGISAVASLQVPYGAFEKEMGPAAQKKQQ
ncbi:BIG1-domain-containing protein [Xylariaceae sp. FL0594]|nr:BIG1-domain-containing protein [Xylariaceae sp. FL0594]